jgi:hypothetical protein
MTNAKQLTFPQKTKGKQYFLPMEEGKNKRIEVNLCDKYQKTVSIAKRYFLMNEKTFLKHIKEIQLNQLPLEPKDLLILIELPDFIDYLYKINARKLPVPNHNVELLSRQQQSFYPM